MAEWIKMHYFLIIEIFIYSILVLGELDGGLSNGIIIQQSNNDHINPHEILAFIRNFHHNHNGPKSNENLKEINSLLESTTKEKTIHVSASDCCGYYDHSLISR